MAEAPANPEKPADPVAPPTKTPSAKAGTTWMDVLNGIIYMLLSAAAVYYGWTLGQKYAFQYWMVVQSLGATIREYIGKMIEYAKRSAQSIQ
jgi:hypothetical protein